MTFLWYGQIGVLVAVAVLEEVAWHVHISNSCFYQVSESWPMGLLFVKMRVILVGTTGTSSLLDLSHLDPLQFWNLAYLAKIA